MPDFVSVSMAWRVNVLARQPGLDAGGPPEGISGRMAMGYGLVRTLARWVLGLFYRRIDLVGLENIPESGPLIVAANHQNALVDPMLLLGLLPRRVGAGCQGATVPPPAHRPLAAPGGRVACPPPAGGGCRPRGNRAMFSAAIVHLGAGPSGADLSGGCAGWSRLPRARNVPSGACVTLDR